MLPWSKAVPKELLPAGRKPLIQHVVEEGVASGVTQICIVIRDGKESIRDYFLLRQVGRRKGRGVEELEELVAGCELTFVYQKQALGLGDAILEAKDFVGSDNFVMMVPDQLMLAAVPATRQLLRRAGRGGSTIWTSLVRLPKEHVRFFAGARGVQLEVELEAAEAAGTLRLGKILTEDETRDAYRDEPYEIRGFGRTVYPPEIFEYLGGDYVNPETGEVDLLKTFAAATQKLEHGGVLLEGEPLDLGTFEGYYHFLPRLWEAER